MSLDRTQPASMMVNRLRLGHSQQETPRKDEGHHIRSGVEGHAQYIECRAGMNNRPSPAGLRVARWMR